MSGLVELRRDALRVVVEPGRGGAIRSVEHVGLGASVLAAPPWEAETAAAPLLAAPDEAAWLARFAGGWPVMVPNAGDACMFDDAFHGFHGEGSVAPWTLERAERDAAVLARRFDVLPLEMRREIAVAGETVTVRETLRATGAAAVRLIWGHHPCFGADLLDGPVAIDTSARRVRVEDAYDPPANPLAPGGDGAWPLAPGKAGPVDLSRPAAPVAAVVGLSDFADAAVTIRRLDGALGATLRWDAATFPFVWLWFELHGTADPPWRGRGRMIGVEPCTTWPTTGLADSERRGGRLLTLDPGSAVSAWASLTVFRPG